MRFHLDGCTQAHAGWNIEPIACADEKMTALRHVEDADVTSAPVRR